MNYGLTAAAVLGVLALSAPKEPQHNLMKLPSFKGILEPASPAACGCMCRPFRAA